MQWLNGAAYPEKRGFSADLESRKKGIEKPRAGPFHNLTCLSLHGPKSKLSGKFHIPTRSALHTIMCCKVAHVDGYRELKETIEICHRLTFGNIAKGVDEWDSLVEDSAVMVEDADQQRVAGMDGDGVEETVRDIRPDIAVLHVKDGDHAGERIGIFDGWLKWNAYNGIGQPLSNFVESDDACCETRTGVGVHIAAMECIGLTGLLTAVNGFVYFTDFADAQGSRNKGERAIVGRYEIMTAPGTHHH